MRWNWGDPLTPKYVKTLHEEGDDRNGLMIVPGCKILIAPETHYRRQRAWPLSTTHPNQEYGKDILHDACYNVNKGWPSGIYIVDLFWEWSTDYWGEFDEHYWFENHRRVPMRRKNLDAYIAALDKELLLRYYGDTIEPEVRPRKILA